MLLGVFGSIPWGLLCFSLFAMFLFLLMLFLVFLDRRKAVLKSNVNENRSDRVNGWGVAAAFCCLGLGWVQHFRQKMLYPPRDENPSQVIRVRVNPKKLYTLFFPGTGHV